VRELKEGTEKSESEKEIFGFQKVYQRVTETEER